MPAAAPNTSARQANVMAMKGHDDPVLPASHRLPAERDVFMFARAACRARCDTVRFGDAQIHTPRERPRIRRCNVRILHGDGARGNLSPPCNASMESMSNTTTAGHVYAMYPQCRLFDEHGG